MPVQHTDAKISINGFLVLATKKETSRYGMFRDVNRIGFEPMTYCLEGSCSIQLSYRSLGAQR